MRIVSLAPSNTEIIYSLKAEDDLVATTSLCDYPEEALEKPSIGGWTNPDIKRVKSFDPDTVLASDDLQDRAVEKIEEEGMEVLQVKPHSLDEVYESIKRIGKLIGKLRTAEKLVERMKDDLERIETEGNPRIYCEEWMDPPMVSGNWVPDLVQETGADYFIDGGRSREFDLERLKQFDPEYIFLNVCGAGENLDPANVEKRDEWQGITALDEGKVFVIEDALLNRPGPRLLEGARKIERKIDQVS